MHVAIIALLILLASCQEISFKDSFYENVNDRWSAGVDISKGQNLKLNKFIVRPKSINIPLLKVAFLNNKAEKVYDCLFFKAAEDNRPGVLKVVENINNISCEQLASEKEIAKITNIFNFKVDIDTNRLKLFVDEKLYEFILLNMGEFPNKKYEAPIKKTFTPGVLYLSDVKTAGAKKELIKDDQFCYKVDDECSITKKNICNQCKNGWHEIIDSKCASTFSRKCGADKCGQKGESACIRGSATVGLDTNFYCINDSPFGFCQEGLRVMCVNEVLVCI